MDYLEEQAMELEALESIFMQDFRRISDTCCEILIEPFSSDADEISHVGAELMVTYPPEYPSVVPEICINITKGLSDAQRATLYDIATATAEENVGTSMVYNIVEAMKAWMADHNVKPLTEHELVVKRKLERSEMKAPESASYDESTDEEYNTNADMFESQAIQHGTMVTIENFTQWKKEFDQKTREKWRLEDEENLDPEAAKRITGKKYFEMHAASGGFLAAIEMECEKQQSVDVSVDQGDDSVDEKADA